MCVGVFLLGFILYGLLVPLGIDYFLFHVGEIFNYNLFKNFLIPFLFLFFFCDPYNSNAGAFDIVLEVSEMTSLSSFHSFSLFCSSENFSTTLSSSSLIHSSASDILLLIPSRVFLISVIVLFVSVCLFFNSYRSLLIDSCIFSICFSCICFQGFWSSLLSLFWILFQVVCLFPLHLSAVKPWTWFQ